MKDIKKHFSRLKKLAFSACVETFRISYCLELWNEDKAQCMGQLPLSISGGWQFTSCRTCIRIDSPEGQIILLVGEVFYLEGVRHCVRRQIQFKRNLNCSFFSKFTLIHSRTAIGVACAAVIATVFFQHFLKKSSRTQSAPSAYDKSDPYANQTKSGVFESTADQKSSMTQFSASTATDAERMDSTFRAADVSPANFKRTKAEKKKSLDKGLLKREKIDPIRCAPIRHVSQSKILERFQGTAHNRRDWYVCR